MQPANDNWPFADLVPLRYGVILADPPWHFRTYSKKGEGKSPQGHYACMDLDAIKRLPVSYLASRDCALVLWATAPMLPQAIDTMTAWGFRFRSAGAWAKQSKSGRKWQFGTGFIFRSATEFWLYGTIGRPRAYVHDVRNLIAAPVREHSRKPDEMRSNLERLFQGPYCELFARETAAGWESWGDEIGKFEQEAA